MPQVQPATIIDWVFAPTWLTVEQACRLSGHDRGIMLHIVDIGGVDTNDEGLIEKDSLLEFQESLAFVLNWRPTPLDTD